MKNGILGIYDFEQDYARNLMEYLNRKADFEFEACIFTNLENLFQYLETKTLDILLLCEGVFLDAAQIKRVKNIFVLSEGNMVREDSEYPMIYKFQSVEAIIRNIMLSMIDVSSFPLTRQSSFHVQNPSLVEFIGVISANGGSGKTTFSMAFGEAYSKSGKVLYLSLEAVGSSFGKGTCGAGMSELIYYLKQRKRGLAMILQSIGEKIGGVDCIRAVSHYGDLDVLEKEDVEFLMAELTQSQCYHKIIFDIGHFNSIAFQILERCNAVYVTHLSKDRYMDKGEAFSRLLGFEEKDDLKKKFTDLDIPKDRRISQGSYEIDNLLDGELGEFVWGVIGRNAG